MGPLGNLFISDIATGKVLKVRTSHYPANVTVEVQSLDSPVGICFAQQCTLRSRVTKEHHFFLKTLQGKLLLIQTS